MEVYFENGDLILPNSEYGDLRFHVQTYSLPSLRFDCSDNKRLIEERIEEILRVTRDEAEIDARQVDRQKTFKVNRVDYQELSFGLTIRGGKVKSIGILGSKPELTSSARKKVQSALEKLISPVVEEHINSIIKMDREYTCSYILKQLNNYKKNVESAIAAAEQKFAAAKVFH